MLFMTSVSLRAQFHRGPVSGEKCKEQISSERKQDWKPCFKANSYVFICRTERYRMKTIAGFDRYVRKKSLNDFLLILGHLHYF